MTPRRRTLRAFATTLAAIAVAAPAQAAPRINPSSAFGVAGGIYVGPRPGGGYGPIVGFFPTYYPGFYGNGYSAYGPPVPTYGPFPGVFGGSDQRLMQNPPIFGFGTGWFGYRSPSPRPAPNFDYRAPGLSPFDGILPTPRLDPSPTLLPENQLPKPQDVGVSSAPAAPPPAQTPCFRLHVRVPDGARVFVDGTASTQSGPLRTFASPLLNADEIYTYEVRAEWDEQGKAKAETRHVTGKPGKPIVVDFGK